MPCAGTHSRFQQEVGPGKKIWRYQIMAKGDARDKITLACTECKQRNYQTYKNKKNDTERLELKKYCPFCRKHTVHRESK